MLITYCLLWYNKYIFFGGVVMEYVALYRKYRPKVLDEVYGQKYIVDIVKNSVLNNRVFHAYLFSGPRGTGKTTIAKLMAKIVNCSNLNGYDPCDECSSCKLFNDKSNPDIIEIDAASNNGVDEIRTIREKVVLMPSVSKYKVYIIDEVHMLSVSAFNALLKTLEEPPEHVIFILATTELDKVPETIISRCQCYDFKRISINDIVSCLKNICVKENINSDDEVLELIGQYCNGGMRDSIGLLDKLVSYSNDITKDLFYDVVGLVNEELVYDIYSNIVNKNVSAVFDIVEKMVNSGKSVELIVEQLLTLLRNISVKNNDMVFSDVFCKVLNGLSDISHELKFDVNQLLCFEIGILKIVNNFDDDKNISREINSEVSDEGDNSKDVNKSFERLVDNVDKTLNIEPEKDKSEQMVDIKNVNFDVVINNAFALADKNLKNDVLSKWNGFNDYVHNKEFSSLVSYFLDSTVQVVGEKDVIVSVSYASMIENACYNIAKLELLFNLVMGKFYNLAFVLDDEWNELKNKYISDMKSGKIYKYIEPNMENSDIIDEKPNDLSDVVMTAKNVFGNDIVEIK